MTVETTPIPAIGLGDRIAGWNERFGLARKAAVALTVAAVAAALATYAALSGWGPFRADIRSILILLNLDLVLLLALATIVARRVVQMWLERRRGAVGARLHIRLVMLFSLIAVIPTIIVSVFSAVFFSLGVQVWFSDRVKTVVSESNAVAQAYLEEHQQTIRGDILAMARDLNRAAPILVDDPKRFRRIVAAQGALRSLSEATVLDSTGRILASWNNLGIPLFEEPVQVWALDRARQGETVLLTTEADDRIRALVKLDRLVDVFLYVSRFVEPGVLNHIERTKKAVAQYEELEGQRSSFEINFAMMFVLVALLLLMVAIWFGLSFATRLTRPISELLIATEQVRGGDLSARVEEREESDEIDTLGRAFNRMADQLGTQREGLIDANRQLDERRHFIETVLAGVSSGVIGLDLAGRATVANRTASELLSVTMDDMIGRRLEELIPETRELIEAARRKPGGLVEDQIILQRDGVTQTLLVRLSAQSAADGVDAGYVATFDDVSELLAAQRQAAWSDVARRIAHEIKNPLTPIQLAAERLRRRYRKEITSDPETFLACTDTIIRQVGDIGRLVDEFSSFARMPSPVMNREDLQQLCRQSAVMFRNAHPRIEISGPDETPTITLACDRRQVGQALTNLLQNAVEAIEARFEQAGDRAGEDGRIELTLEKAGDYAIIAVSDNGRGLPADERHRLTEPYVTTRKKGTGLGLAIVRKIMEDHDGEIILEERPGGGAIVRLVFPFDGAAATVAIDQADEISVGAEQRVQADDK